MTSFKASLQIRSTISGVLELDHVVPGKPEAFVFSLASLKNNKGWHFYGDNLELLFWDGDQGG